MKFYINNKIIKLDYSTLPDEGLVEDNEGYECEFFFDSEWDGKIKTARFMKCNEYVDVILIDDKCVFPTKTMARVTEVGVYSSPLKTTNVARVPFLASILSKLSLPAEPKKSVYEQLLKLIEDGLVQGPPGKAFTFEDFTPEQLESLKVKGNDGAPGVYIGSEEPQDDSVLLWIDPEGVPTQGASGTGGMPYWLAINESGILCAYSEDEESIPDFRYDEISGMLYLVLEE